MSSDKKSIHTRWRTDLNDGSNTSKLKAIPGRETKTTCASYAPVTNIAHLNSARTPEGSVFYSSSGSSILAPSDWIASRIVFYAIKLVWRLSKTKTGIG